MNLIKKLLSVSIFAYIAFCITAYYRPQWFFYHPDNHLANLENAKANGYNAEVVQYTSQDGTPLYAWYTKPEKNKKIIVFLHGNSYNIEKFYHKMLPFAEVGYGTFIPEYRGFGNVAGEITQQGLEQDSLAAVRYLYGQGYKNSEIILYGMSLGTHMALYAADSLQKSSPFSAVVLEVPFDNITNVVKKTVQIPLPLDYLIKDKYDNLELAGRLKSPLLLLGARQDRVVPVELAQNLFESAPNPKKIIIYEGCGHNDLHNVRSYRDVMKWLEKN